MKTLTTRQKEIAVFIENYIDVNGFAPSVRDIADNFGFSPKAAYDHILALKKKGYIKAADNLSRGIAVVKRIQEKPDSNINVPVVGRTGSVKTVLSNRSGESIVLNRSLIAKSREEDLFALKVRGDYLADEGICNNDVAVFDSALPPREEDIVCYCPQGSSLMRIGHWFSNDVEMQNSVVLGVLVLSVRFYGVR